MPPRCRPAAEDIGRRFGKLVVLGLVPGRPCDGWNFRCRCDCGREFTARKASVRCGDTTTCGCGRPSRPAADSIGERFGRLVVEAIVSRARGGAVTVRARCDCGTETTAALGNLRSGMTRSCGCLARELFIARARTHGQSGTDVYRIYRGIIARCSNPRLPAFRYYGGRGVTVCDRWRGSFEAFLEDMGPRPSPGHSVDRIDPNGNYEPGNCRWATDAEQARSRRNNVWIEIDGGRRLLSDVAVEHGVSRQLAAMRVAGGWDPVEAATTPPREYHLRVDARTRSLARTSGISRATLYARIRAGWSPLTAATTAPRPLRRRAA